VWRTYAVAVVMAVLVAACGSAAGSTATDAATTADTPTTETATTADTPTTETATTADTTTTSDTASTTDPATTSDATPISPEVSNAEVEAVVQAFLVEQTSANAEAAVAAIAANGNKRWVPWLLDFLRINVSSLLSITIGETLEAITGEPSESRIPDMISFGSWAQSQRLDGGDGYREFKSTLYERIDPAFGPLLTSVDSQLEVAGIQWGGVPIGGIPELNDPARVPASEATWMFDDEIIIGVVSNGQAVAYPLRILARHELANDTVGGDDLAVVYCTLCRSALVFERLVNGQTLNFLTSGLLLNSNKIMYDIETGTLWHHLRGIGIGGELSGTTLALRSVNHMRWSDWVAENPDTEVLRLPEPIFFDDPERPPISYDYTPGEAYRSYYENPDVWFPVLDTPATFSLKTEVVGIRHNGDAVAFDVAAFNAGGASAEIDVGGTTFAVEPTGAGVRVFDPDGERVITEQSFWFAWYANNPDTRSWPDESGN